MKVYVVLVDYRSGRETKVFGVYKQYRHARQEKEKLLDIDKTLWYDDQINVRIVDQEVTE